MKWFKIINIGHWHIITHGCLFIEHLKITPLDVERYRERHPSSASVKTSRIVAARKLYPQFTIKTAELWVEISFENDGWGAIRELKKGK